MRPTRDSDKLWLKVLGQPGVATLLLCTAVVLVMLGSGWVVVRNLGGTPQVIPTARPEPIVRVRIAARRQRIELTSPGRLLATAGAAIPLIVRGPVVIDPDGDGFVLTDAEGAQHALKSESIVVTAAEATATGGAGSIGFDDAHYPGSLRLVLVDGGVDVVNDLPMNAYLPGVIARELFSHWPEQAFRVQAICSRTYALHVSQHGDTPDRHYDLTAGESAQTYAGLTDNATAIAAVEQTRGLVLTYRGDVIRAYYSSVCGGRSGSARDSWASTGAYAFNAVPPLRAHNRPFACEGAPLYRWTRTRGRDELGARLRAWGENRRREIRTIADVREIEIVRRALTGRPARYAVTDSGGKTFEISAEDLRLACNYPGPGYPRSTDDQRVMSNDLQIAVDGSTVQIAGRGFGHGVGMCQYCAYGMAEAGDSVQTMLQRFFPGAAIERVY